MGIYGMDREFVISENRNTDSFRLEGILKWMNDLLLAIEVFLLYIWFDKRTFKCTQYVFLQ